MVFGASQAYGYFIKVSVQMKNYCFLAMLLQQCGTQRHFSSNNKHLAQAAADCS